MALRFLITLKVVSAPLVHMICLTDAADMQEKRCKNLYIVLNKLLDGLNTNNKPLKKLFELIPIS